MKVAPEIFNFFWIPTPQGCWEWTGNIDSNGYGRLSVGGKTTLAHRYSYYIHCGDLIDGEVVRHSCDNPPCVNPKHLIQGSQNENMQDAIQRNRWSPNHGKYDRFRGEKHFRSVVSDKEANTIRSLFVPHSYEFGTQALAKKFNCSRSTIRRIIQKKGRWKNGT